MPRSKEFSIPFDAIKTRVLGKKYELSLVFVGKKESRRLNKLYRGKDKPTNVLSFSLSKNSGEIFIDLEVAKKEAPEFEKSFPDFVAYLFIHGVLHLSGLDHGSTMSKKEAQILKTFKINGSSHSSRDRHRNLTS